MIASAQQAVPAGAWSAPDVVAEIEAIVSATPDAPAIEDSGATLSYRELWRRASWVAEQIGPGGGAVAVEATRSAQTVIALLGALIAGAAYCPIDPGFPLERRRRIARTAHCRAMVTTRGEPDQLEIAHAIDLRAPGEPTGRPPAEVGGDMPAYLLFTSGSTAEPKPVVTPRRAISAAVRSLRALFELTPRDRVLQLASLNWDTCLEELLPTLTAGACIVIDPDAVGGSILRLVRAIERDRITMVDMPTALWHELVHDLADVHAPLPAALRLVAIGGEAVRPRRLQEWCRLDTARIRLLNTYGCTETTLVTHAAELHGPRASAPAGGWAAGQPVPIGHALPHVDEHIDDEGQLWIGGDGVALGYLNAPVMTAARFVFAELAGRRQRVFLTGDRVKRDASGALLHLGRLDAQLKVRGVRVDPAEVEAELLCHSGVAEVAVVGVSTADHTQLVAYVVPRAIGGDPLALRLRDFLRDRAPAHLIPSQINIVPDLVRTPSGKIDRAASHKRHAPASGARSPR